MLPFSDEDLQPAVEQVLEKVKPMLALDGGNVRLIGIKDGKVYVQLEGACVGCSSSNTTLKMGIEKQLKTDIHPEIVIINVPQGMEANWQSL